MPIISVGKKAVLAELGSYLTDEKFSDLLFDYGLELDEVDDTDQNDVQYRVELPANRYDLLSFDGLLRALKVFQGTIKAPTYQLTDPGKKLTLTIEPSTSAVRPHCVAAVLRNVTLSAESLASFIDLQDKLHMNLGRRRTLVAIGTHDLDTIAGPFKYCAQPPDQIKFKPLNQEREFSATELMEFYKSDNNLKAYLHILENQPLYPVIYDSKGVVLSMPPIINGDHSKMSVNTKNIFIECTAVDLTKARIVLNTIVTLFSQYCSSQFTVEPVDVIQTSGNAVTYPNLTNRTEVISSCLANKKIGISLSSVDTAKLLTKMCLTSRVDPDGDTIHVTIPPTRADILHPCDIYEDIAIAHGYNNIAMSVPQTNTVAHQFPVNKLSDKLKENIAMAGFTEVFTFSLCSSADISTNIGKEAAAASDAVVVANPATLEFQVVRTTLIPGLLKTVASNRKMPLPLRLFEISDVVLLDRSSEVGARNERRVAAIFYGRSSGFEVIHGLLDRILQLLEVVPFKEYRIEEAQNSMFFPNRCARIVVNEVELGMFGILHPEVLKNYDLPLPCSVLELNIEPFVC